MVTKENSFLYRGYEIIIGYSSDDGYMYGWKEGDSKTVMGKHGYVSLEDAIAESKNVMDMYFLLNQKLRITDHSVISPLPCNSL